QHVLCADDVRAVVGGPRAPVARPRCDVEDSVHPEARGLDGRCILKVGADRLDAQCCQIGIRPATQDPYGVPPRQQLHHDGPAEKSPAAGDQRLHRTCSATHRASLSLAIFTLWRTSTGKARWNRTVLIPAVTV